RTRFLGIRRLMGVPAAAGALQWKAIMGEGGNPVLDTRLARSLRLPSIDLAHGASFAGMGNNSTRSPGKLTAASGQGADRVQVVAALMAIG
ncbi:plasmid mobilization relaxosome protein MobC, partial [Klebsiella pneumoniae]|uniref:plasmid mobilization relaxosome protein MobC n=1 Tax=Klebsiella pneumoniae TaxID=573 RepID=UPI0022B62D39